MNMMRRNPPGAPNQPMTGQPVAGQPVIRQPARPAPLRQPVAPLPQQLATQTQAAKPVAAPPANAFRPIVRPPIRPGAAQPAAAMTANKPMASKPGAPAAGSVPGVRPTVKADDLFQVIRQLSELLVKENLALKRHDADGVKALTERKEQLARIYQGHMNAVHRDPSLLKHLEPGKREAMTHCAVRLGELMQENASLLKANIQSINMFFKAVNDALKTRQEEKAAAYSRRGALNGYAVTKRSLAVSFNQTM